MAKNIYGGGSKTNINGLKFEQVTDLKNALLNLEGYSINDKFELYYHDKRIGIIASKHNLYKLILEPKGVNYKEIISQQLLPDEALYLFNSQTVFIIEKKFQNGSGSVDEKLQTCDFKKQQYTKLLKPLNIKVEYIYVLNDWFKQDRYRDVLKYINEKDCYYFFNEIPLDFLGLK